LEFNWRIKMKDCSNSSAYTKTDKTGKVVRQGASKLKNKGIKPGTSNKNDTNGVRAGFNKK